MAIEVKRVQDGRKSWAIYVNGELVEGGFFSKSAALDCSKTYRAEYEHEQRILRARAALSINKMLGGAL